MQGLRQLCRASNTTLCRTSQALLGVQGLHEWPRPPMQFSTTGGIPKMGEEDLVGVVKFGLSLEFDPVRVRPFPIF